MSGWNDRYHYNSNSRSQGASHHSNGRSQGASSSHYGSQASGSSKSNPKMDFYHYTSHHGLQGIMREGRIRQSPTGPGDAFYGKGVYGTSKDPHTYTKSEISKNNYDGMIAWENSMHKLDYAVKVEVPKHQVERAPARNRDVLVHKGDIDLSNTPHDVIQVPAENHFSYY